jgi:hypothetical protein
LIPPVNNALVRAFANHKTLAPKKTIDTASRTVNTRPGFPCDGVNREPHRKEAAGRQVGCSFLSQALCDAAEDTARLVRMPDYRFALVLTGFGAGKVGARRLHEPKPETDLVAISSTMGTRASKSASKVRCTYSLSWQDRHARI